MSDSSWRSTLLSIAANASLGFLAGWLARKRFAGDGDSKEPDYFVHCLFINHRTVPELHRNYAYNDLNNPLVVFDSDPMRIIERIFDQAKHSIDLCLYMLNVQRLGQALVRALVRGVKVRFITCNSMAHSSGSQITALMEKNASVIIKDTSFLMHHKFCLVDVPSAEQLQAQTRKPAKVRAMGEMSDFVLPATGVLINGSANWTMQGFTSNFENISVTNQPAFLEPYRSQFEMLWKDFSSDQMKGMNLGLKKATTEGE